MSTLGKRVIFVGPADGSNAKPLNVEGNAISAGILPGSLVAAVATGLDQYGSASTVFGTQIYVADKDQMRTVSIDTPWTITENMVAIQPRSGEFMNLLVVTGQNISKRGVGLTANGAGILKIAATTGADKVVAYSDEIITTAGTELVRVRIA